MVALCRRCGRRLAATADGYCVPCKSKEVLRAKLQTFGRRQKAINSNLTGGIV